MQPRSLVQLYSSKTDDELLTLAGSPDSLVEEARTILADELRRRNLVVQPTPTAVERQPPDFRNTAIGKFFRTVAAFLLNFAVAVVGTTMIESSIWSRIGHARSLSGVLAREWLLGLTIAAFLGFFVGRRWHAKSAMWVWTLGVTVLAFGVLLYGTSRSSSVLVGNSFSQHFLAPNCLYDRAACRDFFTFTIPAARTASYSLAAWVALLFQRRSNKTAART